MSQTPEIILCIPGQWKSRSEIVTSLALANMKEYIFAGMILLHLPTSTSFEVEVHDADPRLRQAFEVAGQDRLSESELSEIEQHTFVIYIIGKGGSQENAVAVMNAGHAFLKAGGIGIKIETSGKAFSNEQWTEIVNETDKNFYNAFVVLIKSDRYSIYSCGLHNLGLRDVEIDSSLNTDEAIELIQIFIFYLLVDKPTILSGQTFSVAKDAPVFTILEQKCVIYESDELCFNSYGMYYLEQKESSGR